MNLFITEQTNKGKEQNTVFPLEITYKKWR